MEYLQTKQDRVMFSTKVPHNNDLLLRVPCLKDVIRMTNNCEDKLFLRYNTSKKVSPYTINKSTFCWQKNLK